MSAITRFYKIEDAPQSLHRSLRNLVDFPNLTLALMYQEGQEFLLWAVPHEVELALATKEVRVRMQETSEEYRNLQKLLEDPFQNYRKAAAWILDPANGSYSFAP